MRLETFFEKFDQFADAPDAMAKMRELVWQLAVTGKLVAQDPSDEPAEVILTEIVAEKKRLSENGGLKADKKAWVNSSDTPPHDIPESWCWVRLQDVFEISRGGSPRPAGDPRFFGGTIPWITVGEVTKDSDKYLTETATGLTQEGSERSRFINPGDLLLTNSGATLGVPKISKIRGCMNDGVAVLRLFHPFDLNDFGYLYLTSQTAAFRNVNQGMGQPNLNTPIIAGWFFPLPPLAEQKRIVAKVDGLMALCDRLEAQQQAGEEQASQLARASLARFADAPTPANLNFLFHPSYPIPPADLRKSILTLAVQGKLVPQDSNDEPAENCLSRLGLKGTVGSLNGDDAEDDSLPPSWTRVRFEDIALVAGGVTLGRKLADRKTMTLPYLRVANVKRGQIDLMAIKYVSIAEDEIERYALRENDLLMTEGGDWDKVGRAAIWRAEIPVCLHQNHVFRARMRSAEITPYWFERYFNSPVGRSYFESASKQTTNLASINMRQVRSCPIPLPPLAEQRRIVAKVDQLMVLVDQLETQLAASHATAVNLLEAVVAELTAQNAAYV